SLPSLPASLPNMPHPAARHTRFSAFSNRSQALAPPQLGQTKPPGQRAATQAASSGKRCWNSVRNGRACQGPVCSPNIAALCSTTDPPLQPLLIEPPDTEG